MRWLMVKKLPHPFLPDVRAAKHPTHYAPLRWLHPVPEFRFEIGFTAREMITLNLRLRIATQNFHRVRELPEFFERGNRIRIFERRLQIKIETITPWRYSDGAALDLK